MPISPLPFTFYTENDIAAFSAAIVTRRPKACVLYKLRKMKCNRQSPCGACLKVKIECVFPSPLRTCRRHKKGDKKRTSVKERKKKIIYKNRDKYIDMKNYRAGKPIIERDRNRYISDNF